jgi:hypothetical protein
MNLREWKKELLKKNPSLKKAIIRVTIWNVTKIAIFPIIEVRF